MKIEFTVDGRAASFERNGLTGRAVLRVGDDVKTVQSPWNPRTHFAFSVLMTWTVHLHGHEIVVHKERARMFGGLRDALVTVIVDGRQVAAGRGF